MDILRLRLIYWNISYSVYLGVLSVVISVLQMPHLFSIRKGVMFNGLMYRQHGLIKNEADIQLSRSCTSARWVSANDTCIMHFSGIENNAIVTEKEMLE